MDTGASINKGASITHVSRVTRNRAGYAAVEKHLTHSGSMPPKFIFNSWLPRDLWATVFTQRLKMVEVPLLQAQQGAYQRENEALPLQAHGLACSDSAMLRGGWVLRQLRLQGSSPCATLTHN